MDSHCNQPEGNFSLNRSLLRSSPEISRIHSVQKNARRICTGPGDRIFLAADRSILAISDDGSKALEITLGAAARSVAVAGDGTIYAGLRDHVEVFDSKGRQQAVWETPWKKTWFSGLAVSGSELFARRVISRALACRQPQHGGVSRLVRGNGEDLTK